MVDQPREQFGTVRKSWEQFGTVPVDDDGIMQAPWMGFDTGTDREEVWHWFEETYGIKVYDLMFDGEETDERY